MRKLTFDGGETYVRAWEIDDDTLMGWWQDIADSMDDDLREWLHGDYMTERGFLYAYLRRSRGPLVVEQYRGALRRVCHCG